MSVRRDLQLARRANKHGAHYSLRIIREARRAGIPISLGFALISKETGGKFVNVYGGDAAPNGGTSGWQWRKVTRSNYRAYRARRGPTGRGGMQGVGPAQLTWWEFQDRADRLGGCHVPRHNIRAAFEHLAVLRQQHGTIVGLRRYNGTGPRAVEYSRDVRRLALAWHSRLA